MSEVIRIAGIAGSLRKGSYNKSALQAALKLVPKGSSLDILDLEGAPWFEIDDLNDMAQARSMFE